MSLPSLNSIEQSVFESESGNENMDGQTDRCWTHQSNRWFGYKPKKGSFQKGFFFEVQVHSHSEVIIYNDHSVILVLIRIVSTTVKLSKMKCDLYKLIVS